MMLYVILMLLLPVAAFADENLHVSPAACQALTAYTPSADVAYQPGVDVHGHYVAPADVGGGNNAVQMPQKIDIPLTIGLANALHFDTTKYPFNQLGAGTEATLGVISVEGNHVTYNGKPLSDEQQSNLAVLCMKPGH